MRLKNLPIVLAGLLVSVVAQLLAASAARAEVKLPAVFSDNMILQRDQAVPVWGLAGSEEDVTVTLVGPAGQAGPAAAIPPCKTTACEEGHWSVKLPKLPAGGPYELTVKSASGSATVKNILVGEVWLCSGQSNMEMSVANSLNAQQEIAAAEFPKIRLFTVQKKVADEPQTDCTGKWTQCSPKTVGGFSAAGYFFIRKLHRDLGVPVGMIHSSWGGTPAESWISREAMDAEPSLKPLLERWDTGKGGPKDSPSWPGRLYNGMIAPVAGFGIRGAIWYQGESNVGRDQSIGR